MTVSEQQQQDNPGKISESTEADIPVVQAVNFDQQKVPVAQGTQIPETALSYQCQAPSDMPGGYEFLVDINGKATLVRVPISGVKAGEVFLATIVDNPKNPAAMTTTTSVTYGSAPGAGHGDDDQTLDVKQKIPVGRWRTGICGCFDQGCCHAACCLAYWCNPLALGQAMTRMNLDAFGQKRRDNPSGSYLPYWTAFKTIGVVFVVYIVTNGILSGIISPYYVVVAEDGTYVNRNDYYSNTYSNNDDIYGSTSTTEVLSPAAPGWAVAVYYVRMIMGIVWYLWMLIIMILARQTVRNRYNIRGGGCEDCCCSFWCSCCTVTQMLHHTADYDHYNAACCSDTGLPEHAGRIV